MAEPCLLDNDVVLKVATFQQNEAFLELLTVEGTIPAILGVGAYVVKQKAGQSKRYQDPEAVKASAQELLSALETIEPTDAEIEMAAEFEANAMSMGGAFDAGEAQLFAILLSRNSPALVTGDKRAVTAIFDLNVPAAHMKIVCLEQIIIALVHTGDLTTIRAQICTEQRVDKAVANCFACASLDQHQLDVAAALDALQSYVNHLRKNSGDMLMEDEKVLALTA